MRFFQIILIAIIFIFINTNTSQAGILKKFVEYHRLSKEVRCKKIIFVAKIVINNKKITLATIIANDKNIEIIANTYYQQIDFIDFLLQADIPDFHQQKVKKGHITNSISDIKIGVPVNGHIIIPNFFTGGSFNIIISYQMYGITFKTNNKHFFRVCYS